MTDDGADVHRRDGDSGLSAASDPDAADEDADLVTTAQQVDWEALWSEFDFWGLDANGNEYAGKSKLYDAIRLSEQNLGDPEEIVVDAVEKGILSPVTQQLPNGLAKPAGFTLEVTG